MYFPCNSFFNIFKNPFKFKNLSIVFWCEKVRNVKKLFEDIFSKISVQYPVTCAYKSDSSINVAPIIKKNTISIITSTI